MEADGFDIKGMSNDPKKWSDFNNLMGSLELKIREGKEKYTKVTVII